MGLMIILIVGGIIGWLAGAVAGRDEGIFPSIVIGIVGAIIGEASGKLLVGASYSYFNFSWPGIFWSFVGSLILVGLLNAIGHGQKNNI